MQWANKQYYADDGKEDGDEELIFLLNVKISITLTMNVHGNGQKRVLLYKRCVCVQTRGCFVLFCPGEERRLV